MSVKNTKDFCTVLLVLTSLLLLSPVVDWQVGRSCGGEISGWRHRHNALVVIDVAWSGHLLDLLPPQLQLAPDHLTACNLIIRLSLTEHSGAVRVGHRQGTLRIIGLLSHDLHGPVAPGHRPVVVVLRFRHHLPLPDPPHHLRSILAKRQIGDACH